MLCVVLDSLLIVGYCLLLVACRFMCVVGCLFVVACWFVFAIGCCLLCVECWCVVCCCVVCGVSFALFVLCSCPLAVWC